MLKSKKILAMVLMLIFSLTIITGCNNSQSAENKNENEVVTVKFSYPPFGYDSKKEDAFWKKYIAEFEKEHPNIKIEQTVES